MSQNVTKSEDTLIDTRMVIAAELLANPDLLGTKAEIAEKAGVTPRTLYRWLRNPDFVAIVNSIVSQYADAELSMVWKALCKRIQDGDIQAIKLYFELRERGLQSKKTDEQSQEKQTSKLYDTLGDENGTDYETVEEAETGDEVGTYAEISE